MKSKALLIGINKYRNPGSDLNGCINDIQDAAELLTSKYSFPMESIRMLTDNRATKQNIIERLDWLIYGLQPGDRAVLWYSGHGAQIATRDSTQELDGLDEIICCHEFDWEAGLITDKEFQNKFRYIPPGVKFMWISDSCHSGDLNRDVPDSAYKKKKTIKPPADLAWRITAYKHSNDLSKKLVFNGKSMICSMKNGVLRTGSDAIVLISGCKDNQTSSDAWFDGRYNGALSYNLLKVLKEAPSMVITKVIEEVTNRLQKGNYEQQPQVCGNIDYASTHAFLS